MKKKIILMVTIILIVFIPNIRAQMRVHLINVGQGCATLVEFPCAAILVDAGGETNSLINSSDSLRAYLEDFFERRTDLNNTLQCVYLTHPHIDHTRGVNHILQPPYVIKNIVTDGLERGSGKAGQIKLHRLVQAREATPSTTDDIGFEAVTTSEIGNTGLTNKIIDPVKCTGTNPVIKILWGTSTTNPGWNNDDFNDENNHSLVIKIEYGTSSILITGDLEEAAIHSLLLKYSGASQLDADVYLVGHHGSRNGTTKELVNAITPKIALIGVGVPTANTSWSAWAYGHPNKEILEILQHKLTDTRTPIHVQAGDSARKFLDYTVTKAIYSTGWDNTIVLEADHTGNWHKVGDANPAELVPALVNINTASVTELKTLPGIGDTKANAIVGFRKKHGKFTSIDRIKSVPGIGPATLDLISPYIKI
jgi:competence protein ComEC